MAVEYHDAAGRADFFGQLADARLDRPELLIDGDATGTLHPRILEMKESSVDLGSLDQELARLEKERFESGGRAKIHALLTKWVKGYGAESSPVVGGSLRSVSGGTTH